jgi:hypothetical protein
MICQKLIIWACRIIWRRVTDGWGAGVARAALASVRQLGDPAWRAAIAEHLARTASIRGR